MIALSTLIGLALTLALLASLPYWMPPLIIRARVALFTRINGEATVHLPSPEFDVEDFRRVYDHPASGGRSEGAALSDLFWYWLSPGPEIHPEHIEMSERYQHLNRFSRQIMALPRAEVESMIDRFGDDPLALGLGDRRTWTHLRLRDAFMPVWAEFFYEVVFRRPCPPEVKPLIVDHASDVINALKCCKLRDMKKRARLTNLLVESIENGDLPHEFPAGLSTREQALFLQGTFFNTGVVQMSEAMSHLLLALAQHQDSQDRLRAGQEPDLVDDIINESLRLNPLFGIAHRITTDEIDLDERTIPRGTVVCFNYPEYHRTGYENPEQFDPDRWKTQETRDANFIPFGVSRNRSCPAQVMATVAMRQLTTRIVETYAFASPIPHTRSLPNRAPCIVMTDPDMANQPSFRRLLFPAMKVRDRWEDLYRSMLQLVFGTIMVLDARRLKLCQRYFADLDRPAADNIELPEPGRCPAARS